MSKRVETAEEAHFLVRVGTWSPEDLERWVQLRNDEAWEYDDEDIDWDEEEA